MSEISSQILSLIDEAVMIAKGDRIELVNPAAQAVLGNYCTGKRVSSVLGAEIASAQASDYTANVRISGKSYILRVSKRDSRSTFVIKNESKNTELINDAFISSLRSSLSQLIVSAERSRNICRSESDPLLKEAIASLTKNIYVTSRHVSNLSYARSILTDSLEFFPRLVDITEFCSECVSQAGSLLNIEINAEGPDSLICSIDPTLFTILLANLISNAFYHGKADKIMIRLIESGESVILAVTDNGVGIPAEKLGNVFERYRAPFCINEMYDGAGLGLTVVRGIAGKHGGSLLLESREGHGTAVRVSLRKNPNSCAYMRSTSESIFEPRQLLIGLSECLSEKYFASEYMD